MGNISIAKKIKETRLSKGLSQEQLAANAQISLRTIQRIENGVNEPRGHSLTQIAKALNTTTEKLYTHRPDTNAPHEINRHKTYHVILTLSALCFFIFPLFGLIVPFVLWAIQKGRISDIYRTAKPLLIFECAWCLVLGLVYFTLFGGFRWPSFSRVVAPEMILITVVILYLINVSFILARTYRIATAKPASYCKVF